MRRSSVELQMGVDGAREGRPGGAGVGQLGAADVGEAEVLATGAALAGEAAPDPGLLSFALVERGAATTGDAVTTLGSVGERPYLPGIRVGTVSAVHLGVGRLAPTGTITPAVDTTSLDVVAVVLTAGRGTPRPVASVAGTG